MNEIKIKVIKPRTGFFDLVSPRSGITESSLLPCLERGQGRYKQTVIGGLRPTASSDHDYLHLLMGNLIHAPTDGSPIRFAFVARPNDLFRQ